MPTNIKEIIILALPLLVMIYFVIGFIRISFLERKINRLYEKKKIKTDEIKHQPGVVMNIIEAEVKHAELEFDEMISEAERKRRFILDKLPLLKR
jgi:hypothetical protein